MPPLRHAIPRSVDREEFARQIDNGHIKPAASGSGVDDGRIMRRELRENGRTAGASREDSRALQPMDSKIKASRSPLAQALSAHGGPVPKRPDADNVTWLGARVTS